MEHPVLYGDRRSGNCYKPALMLTLLDQAFEWVDIDVMAAETRTERFLAMNPNGRVPLLQLPGDRFLAESNAMLLYLAEGSEYLPDDAWQRAQVYQWLFFEQYSHEPFIAVARFIVLYAGREQEEAERLVQLRRRGHEALQIMDKQLGQTRFIVGDRFTVADIALYAYTHVAPDGGVELASYDNIRRWLDRVRDVPRYVGLGDWPGRLD